MSLLKWYSDFIHLIEINIIYNVNHIGYDVYLDRNENSICIFYFISLHIFAYVIIMFSLLLSCLDSFSLAFMSSGNCFKCYKIYFSFSSQFDRHIVVHHFDMFLLTDMLIDWINNEFDNTVFICLFVLTNLLAVP